jgi:hypothetical protein
MALLPTIPTIPHILPAPVPGFPSPQSRRILARRASDSGEQFIIDPNSFGLEFLAANYANSKSIFMMALCLLICCAESVP